MVISGLVSHLLLLGMGTIVSPIHWKKCQAPPFTWCLSTNYSFSNYCPSSLVIKVHQAHVRCEIGNCTRLQEGIEIEIGIAEYSRTVLKLELVLQNTWLRYWNWYWDCTQLWECIVIEIEIANAWSKELKLNLKLQLG